MNKKCLVLGGAGFIGSHLTDALLNAGLGVAVLDKINCYKGNLQHCMGEIEFLEGDFLNQSDIENALSGVDYVIHLAWTTLPNSSNANPAYDIESNMIGSIRLFDSCLKAGIEKIVFISSGGTVYGFQDSFPIKENAETSPKCSYGITKLAVEKYLALYNHLHGLQYNVVRLANPYGPRQNPNSMQGIVPVFLNKIRNNEKITVWGNGDVVRDYIYISDAVRAIMTVLLGEKNNLIFNVGSGEGLSINELLDIIRKVVNKDFDVEYTHQSRKVDVPVNYLDFSFLQNQLGWQPLVSIEAGIGKTWDFNYE